VASAIVAGNLAAAHSMLGEAMINGAAGDATPVLLEAQKTLNDAANIGQRIVDSFTAQIGKEISVELVGERRTFRVLGVGGNRVFGEQKVGKSGKVSFDLGVADLSTREKLKRAGSEGDPVAVIYRGVMAYQSKAYPRAREAFAKAGPFFSGILLAKMDGIERAIRESRAEQALTQIVKSFGVEVGPFDPAAWAEAIAKHRFTTDQYWSLPTQVEKYRTAFGDTAFTKSAEPVLVALASQRVATSQAQAPASSNEAPRAAAGSNGVPRSPQQLRQ
jgi:hypothetical protein